ncbi:hypothetical protein [Tropicimonas marinistellae]|uniref:hypothetical protein n=1 Tax=Tropicimonas marinistellae TaxID=1739787 RepID=UPI000831FEBE|nr:hypothetical protein [Tropicimonas marinistellae]
MALGEWGSDPVVLPDESEPQFQFFARDVMLDVEPGAGAVELQWRNAANEWETFQQITDKGAYPVIVANGRSRRIVATGDATFCATWSA